MTTKKKFISLIPLCGFLLAFPMVVSAANKDKEDVVADSIIYSWMMGDDHALVSVSVDTTPEGFQQFNPLFREGNNYSFLGNLGSPAVTNYYFAKPFSPTPFFFITSLNPYLFHPSNRRYYNTKRPFANLSYISSLSSKEELQQDLSILHTQNVNEKLNFVFDFNLISSEGQYKYQKNNLAGYSFGHSYLSDLYSMHSQIVFNTCKLQQNGGVNELMYYNEDVKTKSYTTYLDKANTKIRNRGGFLFHELSLGRWIVTNPFPDTIAIDTAIIDSLKTSYRPRYKFKRMAGISHELSFEDAYMLYSDQQPLNGYYDSVRDFRSTTLDSAFYRNLSNTFSVEWKEIPENKFKFGARISIQTEMGWNGFLRHLPDSFIDSTVLRRPVGNNYIHGAVFNRLPSRFNYFFHYRYCTEGFNQSNFSYNGYVQRNFLKSRDSTSYLRFAGGFEMHRPEHMIEHYYSNYFMGWDSNFVDPHSQRVELSFGSQKKSMTTGVFYEDYFNFIYFNRSSVPQQRKKVLSLFAVYLNKKFTVWKFVSKHYLSYQRLGQARPGKSDAYNPDELALNMPEWNYNTSTYIQFPVHFKSTGGRIDFQIGFDLRYTSEYFLYGYNPVINQFFLQDVYKLGNYPYLDAFLNLKIKHLRLLLKSEHTNMGMYGKRFTSVWHYPLNVRTFHIGMSWIFYN